MKSLEEKQLKKIERQIWWIEARVEWLRFVSVNFYHYTSGKKLIYIVPTVFVLMCYFPIRNYAILILGENLKTFLSTIVAIILIGILVHWLSFLDKKYKIKIGSLEQKLNELYKEKSNLTEIINHKS